MNWATTNGYNLRIGIASGDVGSGVFGDGESRPAWDVIGESVNLASRYANLLFFFFFNVNLSLGCNHTGWKGGFNAVNRLSILFLILGWALFLRQGKNNIKKK